MINLAFTFSFSALLMNMIQPLVSIFLHVKIMHFFGKCLPKNNAALAVANFHAALKNC